MIALDLSRLLSHARSATPTGIDRVELAYARHLAHSTGPCCFAARNAFGRIGLLPTSDARQFIAELAGLWRDGAAPGIRQSIASAAGRLRLAVLFGENALHARLRRTGGASFYLSVSHQNLDRAQSIARLKATTGARFVCMIHDLIPLEFPALTRPNQSIRHRQRLSTMAALGDAAIANSCATRDALLEHLGASAPPITVAQLGVDLPEANPPPNAAPYFVCIGTIERRKNHRLLLALWQRLLDELGDRTPRLILIGQRGFGSEDITDQLRALHGPVIEHSDLSDRAMAPLLRGARALLLPSLAEGFGLPVAEALAVGVPVLCSNLPALRGSGGHVPDYLDPADIDAWHRAVLDYMENSPRRDAQMTRLTSWQPASWNAHFAIVERLIVELG